MNDNSERNSMGPTETRTNLIINHLPHNLPESEFHKLFAEIGPIKNYRIMRDLKTGSSFGFGFVDYASSEDASKAILKLNNYPLQHKRLKVSFAQPPEGSEEKETNLYIQNLPRIYTPENLEQLFCQYGKIVQKLVFKDKATGLPRGVGFVRYENKSEAFAAIEAMNGKIPEGGTEPLLVKIAKDNTSKKKSAFQAGFQAGLARGGGGGGRGRGQFHNRGSAFGRGAYTDMGFGATGRGFGNPTDFANLTDFSQQGGKMSLDRANNRYNPIGSGGGYTAGTGIGIAYGGAPSAAAALRDPLSGAQYQPRLTAAECYGAPPTAGPFGGASRAGAAAAYTGRY